MSFFNDFAKGLATQVINTGLRKVSGNLSGLNTSTRHGAINSSDQLPLAPTGNVKNYTFPLDVMSDPGLGNQGHYMMFYINQQNHAKMHFGGKNNSARPDPTTSATNDNLDQLVSQSQNAVGLTNPIFREHSKQYFKDRLTVGVRRAPTTRLDTAIAMYMPASVTTGHSAQYTDTEIGFLSRGAINAYEKFSNQGMAAGLTEIGNMDQDLARALQGLMLNTAGALPGFGGLKAAAEMRSGVVLSDRMELAFKGIDKRTFQYEFKMNPKSEDEAKEIRDIIKAFKFNMLPEFEGSDSHGRALVVPNTFDIEYHWNGAENQFLHKISTCVLESMNVSYGGDKYKTHAGVSGDGAPPIDTTLSLTFKELDLITRQKAKEGF